MLPILFRDEHLVAVHKPSGMLVHRSDLDRHAAGFALQGLRDQLGRRVYAVHRLDRGTSGLLLFALSPEAGRALRRQFACQEVGKTYLAVVRGWPAEAGVIDHPLASPTDDPERSDASGAPRQAVTRFRRLAIAELSHSVDRYPGSRYALVELEPLTGRRHQLRRHLKHLAHPVIGDATYGKGRHNRLFQTLFGCHRLLLACVELRLRHPATSAPMTLMAPLAADFAGLLQQLGWTRHLPPHWLPEDCAREVREQ